MASILPLISGLAGTTPQVVAIDRLPAASHWYEEEVRLVRWRICR